MEYRSSLGAQTFPRLLHRWDDRSIGQFESRLQSRKRGGGENWSLRWLAGGRVCKRLPKSRLLLGRLLVIRRLLPRRGQPTKESPRRDWRITAGASFVVTSDSFSQSYLAQKNLRRFGAQAG
jgi:hypothetical protein